MSTKVITLGQLQKGDVILSTTNEAVSKVVKLATISNYSHARLYVGGEHIIEAIDPEVVKVKLVDVMKGDLYTVVYRYPGLSEAQKNKIMTYARKQIGKQYDLSGAIGSSGAGRAAVGVLPTMANLISPESDFYCSELVAFSYKKAGVPLEWFSSQTTPKDLANNSKLIYIGHLKVSGMNAP
ncbi:TPA: YiiX/YebB-like N1pC/P60 family cysteine hydrolase [Vibrio vulnificus]|uniref:YiiX/YebB-like N1pC/P60 family cysteine hydrolase n=1 Tax=Vibrio vulnificus TaxID=672 RepID=UPI001CDC41F9|nr:YiiX/YebB-like N1pC/P60 family cysteine hydrolase [Vibrio vulnificus]